MLLARSPDIAMSVFFLLAAVLAVQESFIEEFLADELSLWFIYELVGAYFLLLWVALNERRKTRARNDVFRFASTWVVYFGCAMLMHFVFRASLSSATMSAVGGIWALLNPLVRYDDLTVFQIGREAVLAILALTLSFFAAGLFASIAEQTLPRPFHRATFDAATLMAIGAVYYPLRWLLIARLTSTETA